MGLFNDSYDAADIIMTEKNKGRKAAAAKKKEIQAKRKRAEEAASD